MAHPKLTNELKKLLELAESSNEKVKFEDTEIEQYIHENNIEKGTVKISSDLIYYSYYRWKLFKKDRISRRKFFVQFKKHFEGVRTSYGKGYLLNPEPFDLTQEGYFRARALLRRERDVRKKVKEKKSKK